MKSNNLAKILLSTFIVIFAGVTFLSCNDDDDKQDDTKYVTIKGVINTVSDPCHLCGIVIDVKNIENIGISETYQCGCGTPNITLSNSILIPNFWDWNTDSLVFSGEGKEKLNDFSIGSEITIVCKLADSTDTNLFTSATLCTANHMIIQIPEYVVNSVVNLKK